MKPILPRSALFPTLSDPRVIDMTVAISQARHSGFFGAWEGRSNPHVRGTRLWKEWNLGRMSAATGKSESVLLAEAEAKKENASRLANLPSLCTEPFHW